MRNDDHCPDDYYDHGPGVHNLGRIVHDDFIRPAYQRDHFYFGAIHDHYWPGAPAVHPPEQ